jgi:hypothetical protein
MERPSPELSRPTRLSDWLLPFIVAIISAGAACFLYVQFLQAPEQLWWSGVHDRNAHYAFALNLALDMRQGHLAEFCEHLDQGSRVWAPLHGLLLAPILAVAGPHYWLGVLPSLAAWAVSVVLAFLVARRAAPTGGNLAGCVAAVFLLVSPAFRAFATDIMLESLGACLTLAVLYFYLCFKQDNSLAAGRGLGISLTLLFFNKSNYWVLAVIGLTSAELVSRPAWYFQLLFDAWARFDLRRWTINQLRNPFNYVLVAAVIGVAVIVVGGIEAVELGGLRIAFRPVTNLATILYALAILRILPWWWQNVLPWIRSQAGTAKRALFVWHGWPVSLWFLYPHRLGLFLYYVGPNHRLEKTAPLTTTIQKYAAWVSLDYHVGVWALVLALALAFLGVIHARRLRPGGSAILTTLFCATLLCMNHPLANSRFLHSWIATLWVTAGLGAAELFYGQPFLASAAWKGPVRDCVSAAAGILVLFQLTAIGAPGHAPEGGPNAQRRIILPMTNCYLDQLGSARQPVITSDCAFRFMETWTFLERYGSNRSFDTELTGSLRKGVIDRQAFEQWARTSPCDTVVFIHGEWRGHLPDTMFATPGYEHLQSVLETQTIFHRAVSWNFPEFDCEVTLWSRK